MKRFVSCFALGILVIFTLVETTLGIVPGPDLAEECQDPVRRLELKYIHGIECPGEPISGAEVEKMRRELGVQVRTAVPERYFVGDEPVQVRYEMLFPFDVRIGEIVYGEGTGPFEVINVSAGRRFAFSQIKDYEIQRVTLTISLPMENEYGKYVLPPLSIPYEYDMPTESGIEVKKRVAMTDAAELQKVPLFVNVEQNRDAGFIGDVFTFRLDIHADENTVLMNKYPPDKSRKAGAYLSNYKPEKPWVLLNTDSEESRAEHYRIIRWQYAVSPHEIGEEVLELSLPQVVWRQQGKSREDASTVAPDPIRVRVLSITESDSTFKPMKGVRHEPAGDHTWLLTVPRLTLWGLSIGAIIFAFTLFAQMLRTRRRQIGLLPFMEVPERPKAHYDKWLHQRLLVTRKARKTRDAFQMEPSRKRCIELRALLARRAAMRLSREDKISVERACAMTASELERLVGQTPEMADIRELDRQLETSMFKQLPWMKGRRYDI